MKKKCTIWKAAAVCAGICAGASYLINRAAFSLGTAGHLLKTDQGRYFDWKFGRIYYEEGGEGTPLLLLHDASCSGSGLEWEALRVLLEKEHRVYTLDLPGCGRSDREKMLYTNYLYVAAVHAFCEKVIGQKTDLVSSGLSSTIAVMACHAREDLFSRLICISPESFSHMAGEASVKDRILGRLMMIPLLGTSIYVADRLLAFVRDKRAGGSCEKNSVSPAAGLEAALMGGPAGRFARASMIGRYTDMPFVFALKKLIVPLCVISGRDEPESLHTAEGYRYFCGQTETYTVDGPAMPHCYAPEETAGILEEFLMEAVSQG